MNRPRILASLLAVLMGSVLAQAPQSVNIRGTVSSFDGRTIRVDIQNEFLIARDAGGTVLAVVPDRICLVDEDTGEPIGTEAIRYGLRVAVLGIPAPVELKTPEALEIVGPAAFGYRDVTFAPMAGTYGSGVRRA